MRKANQLVSEIRKYGVLTTTDAKTIADLQVHSWGLDAQISYGLPEVDDRYHVWRVPLLSVSSRKKVGEIVVDAKTSLIDLKRSAAVATVRERLGLPVVHAEKARDYRETVVISKIRSSIISGDSEFTLEDLPAGSVDLIFTSPPYFNARPDYSDFVGYEEYLLKMRKVIQQCHRVLGDGRFFVINTAPVLIRRSSRAESSRRLAVPFDLHRVFSEEGFDFIDDIIWEKPEGAGWATGRGRRFAADRNPLQYKAVPVTEYVLVYRRRTSKLIDWHIRSHPDPDTVRRSRISGTYEKTNIWRIHPAFSKQHPAVFPVALAERVIRYYSFENDVVLDPFAGLGTVGEAAIRLNRRFVLAELNPDYIEIIRERAVQWLGKSADDVMCIGCRALDTATVLV